MQYFSWEERFKLFAAPCMIFFFFLFGCNFSILLKKKKKNLEFECRRVISFIFISCDGMNNVELVILFAILRLFHEEHNWKLLSTIAGCWICMDHEQARYKLKLNLYGEFLSLTFLCESISLFELLNFSHMLQFL